MESFKIMANNSSTSGVGFTGLLTLAFIILKLTHVIGWSWWWVLSPIWITLGLAAVLGLVGFILKKLGK